MSAITGTPLPQSISESSHDIYLEPSPASTFGSSVTSDIEDEIPQTPNDEGVLLSKLSKFNIHGKSETIKDYSPTFIRNGVHSDDPFSTSSTQSQGSAQRTPTGKNTKRALNSVNWHSGSSSGHSASTSGSPLAIKTMRSAQRGQTIHDLASETDDLKGFDKLLFNSQDAQAIYPPSSCVFVANLLQSESDEALEVAVLEVFREFGTVFVKIRRDSKHMPFAFCQYTNDESAELAIKDGRGRFIKGRPCRCEKAKAHRLFFFERKFGSTITPDEVERLLRNFGRLTECRPATQLEMTTNNLGEGVVVNFDMFESGKNACQAFRNHAVYKMISLFHLGSSRGDRNQSDPARRAYLDTYQVDRRSIFVGNLPADINELEVKQMFMKFGDIVNVTVHKNESIVDPSSKHCFAFVEFLYQPSVEKAIPELNGFVLHGKTLRVSQKDSEIARTRPRRQLSRPNGCSLMSSFQSPAIAPPTLCQPPFLAPPVTGQSQFGNYGYTTSGYPSPFFFDARGQYWVTPNSPYNHSYQNTCPFQTTPFQNSQFQSNPFYSYSGSPQGQPGFNWHQAPAPAWGTPDIPPTVPNPNTQVYSAPFANFIAQNDQNPATNPSSHTIVDSSKELVE